MKKHMCAVLLFLLVVGAPLMATAPRESAEAEAGETITLTWFMEAPSATQLQSRNEMAAFQEIEKRTGVHIEWQQPAVGAFDEQFTLILASGEFPDLLWGDWAVIPGGPQKYIDDRIIIALNDYSAGMPNYQRHLSRNPEIKKTVSTQSGKLSSEFKGGNSEGNSSNTNWWIRSGRGMSLSIWRPRSRISTPLGRSSMTRAVVVSESNTCPPWPIWAMRMTALTARLRAATTGSSATPGR